MSELFSDYTAATYRDLLQTASQILARKSFLGTRWLSCHMIKINC